ncbi:MAG TPA: 30S ribosomal protein S20 [Firmicutes bacterium]|jgi:small subunit ribosomal protein S20|nr:30S ribosomal protein S20 [Bacillota bacterium]
MANTRQAKKRIRITAKRTLRNRQVKSMVKTAVRRFNDTLAQEDLESAGEKLRLAVKMLDKAVSKGVLHKNAASRKKSRLARRYNDTLAQAEGE